jgi:hypothetical protein
MLARDADERAAGEPRDAESRDGVRETASGGDGEHARSAARARVRVGGIGARLLVPHVDHLHVVLAEVREDRPDVATVDGEEETDALLAEDPPDERAAVELRVTGLGERPPDRIAHAARAVAHGRAPVPVPRARAARSRRSTSARALGRALDRCRGFRTTTAASARVAAAARSPGRRPRPRGDAERTRIHGLTIVVARMRPGACVRRRYQRLAGMTPGRRA